jgi:hypothetical protein
MTVRPNVLIAVKVQTVLFWGVKLCDLVDCHLSTKLHGVTSQTKAITKQRRPLNIINRMIYIKDMRPFCEVKTTTLTHEGSMKETIHAFSYKKNHYEHQKCGCWQYSREVLRK